MSARPAIPPGRDLAGRALVLLAGILLLASCASGPSYGAARKKKKSCDCPHFNRVDRPGPDVHARTGYERGDRP